MDAKVIAAISDMDRDELRAVFHLVGIPYEPDEKTEVLRDFVRGEYQRGELNAFQILSCYEGGL